MAVSPAHGSSSSMSPGPSPSSPIPFQSSTQPVLDDQQIHKLEDAALRLVENLPELEPKYQSTKKKVCKELQASVHGVTLFFTHIILFLFYLTIIT